MAEPGSPRHADIVEAIMTALGQQTLMVPGTAAAELVLPKLAAQLAEPLAQRDEAERQLAEGLDAPSCPGRAYAGMAPVTSRSRHLHPR